jgi:O-antigen/teichoic acid export membrane protein
MSHKLLWIIATRFGVSAAGLLVGIVLARTLGPDGLGTYANLLASAVIIGTVFCLGMEVPYNMRAARHPNEGTGLLLLIGGQALLGIPVAAAIWFGLGWIDEAARPSWLLIPAVAAFTLNQLTLPVLSGSQRQITANLVAGVLLVVHAGVVFAVSRTSISVLPVAIVSYIGSLLGLYLVAVGSRLRTGRGKFEYGPVAVSLLGEGRAYLLATACGILRMRANVALLGWHSSSSEIGNYQIMQTFMEMLFLIPLSVSTYLLSSRNEGRDFLAQARVTTAASFAITAVAALAIALALPWIVPVLYGKGFEQAVALAPFMLAASVAFAITKGAAAYFARTGHAALVTRLEFMTTCVFLAAAIPSIERWGLSGAVYSFLAATWSGAILHLFCFARIIRRRA